MFLIRCSDPWGISCIGILDKKKEKRVGLTVESRRDCKGRGFAELKNDFEIILNIIGSEIPVSRYRLK